jgi:uncharacterized protein (TIGR02145 family)
MIQSGNSFVTFPINMEPNIKYGYLYNWFAASNALFAPAGWHVATDAEWTTLTTYLTDNGYGYEGSGSDIGKSMASTSGWTAHGTPGTVGNDQASNNSSGFAAQAGGIRNRSDGTFDSLGSYGNWWSSTARDASSAWVCNLGYINAYAYRFYYNKQFGFSVRLIKDNSTLVSSLTDLDGNVYRTVKIGDQVWLSDNWACTKLNDSTSLTKVTGNSAWVALTTEGYCAYANDENNVFI